MLVCAVASWLRASVVVSVLQGPKRMGRDHLTLVSVQVHAATGAAPLPHVLEISRYSVGGSTGDAVVI